MEIESELFHCSEYPFCYPLKNTFFPVKNRFFIIEKLLSRSEKRASGVKLGEKMGGGNSQYQNLVAGADSALLVVRVPVLLSI
jgi:hypothetical protein